MTMNSIPSAPVDCLGTKASVAMKNTCMSWRIDSAARPLSPEKLRILSRFSDTATNTKPVSVAAAPACTANSVFHSLVNPQFNTRR